MPPVMIEPISPKSGRLVSFLFEGDETVSCEVCLEPFQPTQRPPKILPCGHNFCSQCLFSLCCHQEYYLLDSINCPTCRRQFSTNTAKHAPTNYDLCKILENVQKGRELNNITVIHVSGFEEKLEAGNGEKKKWKSSEIDRERKHAKELTLGDEMRKLSGSKREKIAIKRCLDCKRKVTTKNLAKLARHCEECSANTSSVNFSCLECCVNLHNGHRLYSIQQMCAIKIQVLSEVREIRNKTLDAGEQFERRFAELRAAGAPIDCPQLVAAKQNCMNEALSNIDATIRRLEAKKLLPAAMLKVIRESQYAHYTRVSQINARLEKSVVLPQPETPVDAKKGLGRQPSFLSTSASSSRLRQQKLTVRGDDSLAREALHTITHVLPQTNEKAAQLAETVMRFSPRDTVEQRKQLYLNATTLLTQILYDDFNLPTLEMFKDVFLNCFYQLHVLSRKKNDFGSEKKITRKEIWKGVQFAYNELLKIASKKFAAAHPERIDVIDDLAYLCHLFADVCDQGTVTICMIEAARARASDSLLDVSQRELAQQRLQQIDDHLLDCRRVQKLHQLRSNTEKRKGLKSFFACLRPSTSP
ncbi:unnamed protein product, partial [Mesorhabditis belari]|uniref:RING-type domain-containing protein n=1 Tax=Mesorhabditis belari TaxID=2138241 RepID=A0AAF3ELY8_9BILA